MLSLKSFVRSGISKTINTSLVKNSALTQRGFQRWSQLRSPDDEDKPTSEEAPAKKESEEKTTDSLAPVTPPATAAPAAPAFTFPEEVEVVPLHRRPLLPGTMTTLVVYNQFFIHAMQKKQPMGLFFVKPESRPKPGPNVPLTSISAIESDIKSLDQIYTTGSLGNVIEFQQFRDGSTLFTFEALERIEATEAVPGKTRLTVKIKRMEEAPYDKSSTEVKAYIQEFLVILREYADFKSIHGDSIQMVLNQLNWENPNELADYGAAILQTADPDIIQKEILQESNVVTRLQAITALFRRELDTVKLQAKIQKQMEEKVSAQQKKYFLTEQLKQIKKELGLETDEKEALLTKFRERLQSKTVPDDVRKVIDEEMLKLQSLEPTTSEFNVTRNYLDWLTILPWGIHTSDNLDIPHAEDVLNEDHYGLKDLKERILEFIAVGSLKGSVQGKIICFVGPPGVGKTSIGKSIARALKREFYRFSVGGMGDVAEIKGHRRTYVGAMPGKIIQCLKVCKTSNPVIMIDEIDKLGRGYTGDPASALLEVLDPEQNHAFLDHYLDVPYDLSKVLFICTANVLDTIPKPLLDRMEVMRLSGYIVDEKVQILNKYLMPQGLKDTGLSKEQVDLTEDAVRDLIQSYCREAGVRNLQKHVEKILRKIAYKVARGEKQDVFRVESSTLATYVGKPVYNSDRFYAITPPGVTMGLAWTALGGATLYIETVAVGSSLEGPIKQRKTRKDKEEGEGEGGEKKREKKERGEAYLKTTGQMGDVMKESTDIAYTYARRFLASYQPSSKFFEQSGIHMHIPEGATPKDGPSAGVTMVTSLLSLALDRPVKQNLAMTGELSLTGKVLPIGGVKEKVIAAKRSGVTTVILPDGNRKDWEELEENIRGGISVVFAETYKDVFAEALPVPPKKKATAAASEK